MHIYSIAKGTFLEDYIFPWNEGINPPGPPPKKKKKKKQQQHSHTHTEKKKRGNNKRKMQHRQVNLHPLLPKVHNLSSKLQAFQLYGIDMIR